MSPTYAAGTEVPAERSRGQIEKTITRYGATQFAYGWDGGHALVGFRMHDRQVRFALPLPDPADRAFRVTPTGRSRTAAQAKAAHEQAIRQRWRALALVIQAKLEAVESRIVTFEQEFAMHMVLPSGRTVADEVLPAIDQAYATGQVRPLLQIGAGS
jgi:hypothetical protein